MRYIVIFIFMSISICFAGEKYVRKQLKPNFYIPQNAISNKEKLPPIYIPKPPMAKVEESPVEVEEYYEEDELDITENKTEGGDLSISDIVADDKYIDFITTGYTEKPIYGQKFEEYSNDLLYISETGKYPKNENLDKDLSQMNSNDSFVYK